jgi:hypothetical protein
MTIPLKAIDDWMYRRHFITILALGWLGGLIMALLIIAGVVLLWNPAQPFGALLGFSVGALLTLAGVFFATERWG